jgi:hypothetical protein
VTTTERTPCLVDGCGRTATSKGYCAAHYLRVLNTGSPGCTEIAPRRGRHDPAELIRRDTPTGLGANECWPWTGRTLGKGYATISTKFGDHYRPEQVGRILLGLMPGDGLVARHKCDNPPCVNPAHLLTGTASDNQMDAIERGRKPQGEAHRKAKLTEQAVREIRSTSEPARVLAARFGVSESLVGQVRRREIWKHVP